MWARTKHAGPYVMAVVALALSIGTLHKERKTRHRVDDLVKGRERLLKQQEHLREAFEVLGYDIEGARARVEALWEKMERPEEAASPETARR
jgi:predicted  nucleic acid-binding Zn-ribbon protein